jgi:hypothetical protein
MAIRRWNDHECETREHYTGGLVERTHFFANNVAKMATNVEARGENSALAAHCSAYSSGIFDTGETPPTASNRHGRTRPQAPRGRVQERSVVAEAELERRSCGRA